MYAVLGVGGLAIVLLLVVLVVVLTRGGGEPAAKVGRVEVAQNESPAPAIEPVAAANAGRSSVVPIASSAESVPAGSSASSNIDSAEIVRRLKEATVYFKHKVNRHDPGDPVRVL